MRARQSDWGLNPEFGEYRGAELPLDLLEKVKYEATREISDFTVSLILNKQLIGSGTLVTAGDAYGILTAYHVAELFHGNAAGVNISDRDHQFVVPDFCLEHLNLGQPRNGAPVDAGPDLALMKILDAGHVGTIKSRKSFYRLTGKSPESVLRLPYDRMPWWVAGAPGEFARSFGDITRPDHTLAVTHFHAEATFRSFEDHERFDLLKVTVLSGSHSFPQTYGGVSGGGIWFSPLCLDPEKGLSSMQYEPPFLMGVAFCQSGAQDGERVITGHGPKSVYQTAARALTP